MSDRRLPDENWENDYSRRREQWVHEKFIYGGDLDDFFPETSPSWIECGYKISDLKRAFNGAKTMRMALDNLVKLGDHLADVGDNKEDRGMLNSAHEYYHRASLCYFRASWGLLNADDPDKQDWHGKGLDAFEKVVELNPTYEMERVEIELPFHEETLPAVFHKCGAEPAPTVLHVPGMDMVKEENTNPRNNRLVARGMNVLTIDGPGQGEARLRGICADTLDRYQKAGSAAIDWLVDRPEVDEDRIGVWGISMGSYWAPRIVYEDDRVAALACYMGSWYSKDMIFEQAQPFFKKRFMYMAGFEDEAAFDEHVRDMTLHGLEDGITVPTFIAHGEYDELQSREQAKRFYEKLPGPKRLQLYENEFHGIGRATVDVRCDIADWFERIWEEGIDDEYAEAVLVPDYPTTAEVPSTGFDFLDIDNHTNSR
jgi:alpha-beta hydrolase superfamily lysophospholipase